MPHFRNSNQSWGLVSQSLHWLTALLIVIAAVLGLIADSMANSPEKLKLFVYHKSIGITVLALVVLRLLWKFASRQPAPAQGISSNNEKLAQAGQWGLYLLMVVVPFTGWIINSAANFPFQWMNLFVIPDLPGVQPSWQDPAIDAHWLLFLVLAAMVGGHVLMSVIHHRFHQSNLLQRMLPVTSIGLFFSGFIATLGVSVLIFLQLVQTGPVADTVANPSQTIQPPVVETTADLNQSQRWLVDANASQLGFTGRYEGAAFTGEFQTFTADIYFDPATPSQSYFNVIIDAASVTTYSDDFDSSLLDEEWFFVSQFPQATYRASQFQKTGDGYIAQGLLILKGVEKVVPLNFQWQPQDDGQVRLTGVAEVDRTVFGIGSGAWARDPTIAFNVDVKVNLLLSKAP